jgi:hypothetical protein
MLQSVSEVERIFAIGFTIELFQRL